MKYCHHCGAQIEHDDAVICVKCGCALYGKDTKTEDNGKVFDTLIVVFMWVCTGIIALSTLGIGLAWCLPMTLSVSGKLKRKEQIGMGMKICTLLFVSLVSGILLLVKDEV